MMPVITVVILVFVGIVIMVLIHVCMVEWIFYRSQRPAGNTNNLGDRNGVGNASMSKEDVESLPCFDFISKSPNNNGAGSPLNCVVCLDTFKVGDKCRLLPLCNHSFHADCVDAWLLKMPSCPICRSRADSGRSGVGEGSSSRPFSDLSSISNIVAESGDQLEGGSSRFGDLRSDSMRDMSVSHLSSTDNDRAVDESVVDIQLLQIQPR